MGVAVSPVAGPAQLTEFLRFPDRLHRGSPWYVPPLERERRSFFDPRRNPFFRHADVRLYLARNQEGRTVGRISAHVDHAYVRFHGERTGFFGFLDAIDDAGVVTALLREAEGYLAAHGMERVLGPFHFTANDAVGVLVEGFDGPPALLMPYNGAYYDRLVRGAGYAPAKDLLAYDLPNHGRVPAFLERACRRARASSRITLRRVRLDRFAAELELVKEIYNAAWEKNWGFVPMAAEEVAYLAATLRPLVDPSLVYFAFVDGAPAGFFLALPDYNQVLKHLDGKLFPWGVFRFLAGRRRIDRIRVMALGVKPPFRGLGIEALFLEEVHRAGHAGGFRGAELSWVLEDNEPMNRILRRLAPSPYRRYRVYGRAL